MRSKKIDVCINVKSFSISKKSVDTFKHLIQNNNHRLSEGRPFSSFLIIILLTCLIIYDRVINHDTPSVTCDVRLRDERSKSIIIRKKRTRRTLRFTNVKNMVASFFTRDINTYNCCHSRNSSYSDSFKNRSHSPISRLEEDNMVNQPIGIKRGLRQTPTGTYNLLIMQSLVLILHQNLPILYGRYYKSFYVDF